MNTFNNIFFKYKYFYHFFFTKFSLIPLKGLNTIHMYIIIFYKVASYIGSYSKYNHPLKKVDKYI